MGSATTIGPMEAVRIAMVAMTILLTFVGVAGYIVEAWCK